MTFKYALKNILRRPLYSLLLGFITLAVGVLLLFAFITYDICDILVERVTIPLSEYYRVIPVFENTVYGEGSKFYKKEKIEILADDCIMLQRGACSSDIISFKPLNFGSGGADFLVYGVGSVEEVPEFISGEKYVIEGSPVLKKGDVIIDRDLALINGIKLGDTVTFIYHKEEKNLTVTGLYVNIVGISGHEASPTEINRNEVYISNTDIWEGFPIYDLYVKDPSIITEDSVTKWPFDIISVDTYNKDRADAVKSMKLFSLFLIVGLTLCATLFILLIVVYLIGRRKKELGVLIAVGISRKNAALGILTEYLVVFLAAGAILAAIALPVSKISIDISAKSAVSAIAAENYRNTDSLYIEEEGASVEFIENSIDAAYIWALIPQIEALLLSAFLAAFLFVMLTVIRLEPIRILSGQNG